VALLIFMALASLYVLVTYPPDFGLRIWNNPGYWADYPREAPPAWINLLNFEKLPEHMIAVLERPSASYTDGLYFYRMYEFTIDYRYTGYPSFLSFSIGPVEYRQSPPIIEVTILRPDDRLITLYTVAVSPPFPSESPPYKRFTDQPFRVLLSRDSQAIQSLHRFLIENGASLSLDDVARIGPERVIFQELGEGGLRGEVLEGVYIVRVSLASESQEDRVGWVRFVMGGRVYGLSGTDKIGRDLAAGLLFGFPVALLIGLVTSGLTTSIGSSLGIMSGYLGGRTDELIQRFSDILNNIPLLPLLIFFTFVFKPSIWILVLILVVFGWSGLAIVVRAMVLQVKSEQYVEAAISLGASKWRIMARHISPRIAPFIFAQMIFSTPSAILAEAALSFLGLGDPSLPSWGQILDYSFRSGGVNVGLWWWVVPPGLLIVMTGLTFVLLSLGLEPVVSPRLRRLR
ncbi:MAG: ABC transporter permease, partial [Nitrososphaerota archaeon]